MSSSDDHGDASSSAPVKKRKIQRACDICRRKKIRCDGAEMNDNKCSNCVAYGFECTYIEAAKKRGPPKGYVESLENRLEKMERLLKQLVPDIDLSGDPAKLASSLDTLAFPKIRNTSAPAENHCAFLGQDMDENDKNKAYSAMNIATLSIRNINNELASQKKPDSTDDAAGWDGDGEVDADDLATLTLADNMKRMTLDNEYRFFGKSSGVMLIQTALDIKKEYARATAASSSSSPSSVLQPGPSSSSSSTAGLDHYLTSSVPSIPFSTAGINQDYRGDNVFPGRAGGGNTLYDEARNWMPPSLRRPEFWTNRPWERSIAPPSHHNSSNTTNTVDGLGGLPAPAMPHPYFVNPVEDTGSEFYPPLNATSTAEPTTSNYIFPPPDLRDSLVELYFRHSNTFLPLLHKPTFLKHIKDGRHLQGGEDGDSFGANVLLVCAVGSRWSDDPRVRLDSVVAEAEAKKAEEAENGEDDDIDISWHSNGWKYFNQVQLIRKSLLQPPGLWDLQFYCLSVMFLQATSAPQACWTMVGIGIRLAQDVGAHRRKIRKSTSSSANPVSPSERLHLAKERMEEEEWARAWWVLVVLDRLLSSAMGRPCAIQDEDFDLELPQEVDDEYWEDPIGENDVNRMFKQPEGKPSLLSCFVQWIKLMKLLAFSLRTIYSINKSKILLGLVGHQWEQHIVAEIDSALNKWVDSVPDHLRWDPHHPNRTFFNQSVLLYVSYYHLQILIHRPFIPSPRKPSPLSFPSLAICTNAARSCSHIVDIHRRRILKEEAEKKERGELPEGSDGRTMAMQPYNMVSVFTAGIVLLLNIWGGKRSAGEAGPSSSSGIDLSKEMGDVHKCMMVLKLCEERWHSAGRLWDILAELASVGDLPLPSATRAPTSNKRGREDESSSHSTTPSSGVSTMGSSPSSFVMQMQDDTSAPAGARNIASNKRVQAANANLQNSSPMQQPEMRQTALHPQQIYQQQQQQQQQTTPGQQQHQEFSFALPMYSNELGSLPLHGFGAGDFTSMPGHAQQHQPTQSWYNPQQTSVPSSSTTVNGHDLSFLTNPSPFFSGSTAGPSSYSYGASQQGAMPDYSGMSMHPHQGTSSSLTGVVLDHTGMPNAVGTEGFSGLDMGLLDNDTMTMWSNAPTGFELDDWGAYLELAQGMHHAQHHGGSS